MECIISTDDAEISISEKARCWLPKQEIGFFTGKDKFRKVREDLVNS